MDRELIPTREQEKVQRKQSERDLKNKGALNIRGSHKKDLEKLNKWIKNPKAVRKSKKQLRT